MRQYGSNVLASLLLISTQISAQEPGRVERGPRPRPEHVETYAGNVLLRTEGARIFVMVDTITDRGVAPDGLVDQWFILQTAEASVPLFAHLPDALLVHSAGALRVTTTDRRFDFVLADDDRTLPTPQGLDVITTRTVGVGLSHSKGTTTISIGEQLDRGSISTTSCMDCEVLDPDPDPGGGGSGGASCVAGGTGSSSCSVTAGSGGYSCSVSCASGYYSCCNSTATSVSCRCYGNP